MGAMAVAREAHGLLLPSRVQRKRARATSAMALAMVLLIAAPAAAERLLTPLAASPTPGSAAAMPGVARVQALALGRGALADLRTRAAAVVEDFPLAGDGLAALMLTRIEPFAANARVEVMEAGGPRRLTLPNNVYFAGALRGEPTSRVVLVATPETVDGFVTLGEDVYVFGPDGAGGHRAYALRDVDDEVYPAPGNFCENDLHPELSQVAPPAPAHALVPPTAGAPALKEADIAIETDRELRAKFTSDAAALDYLARLAAASNAIYERDVAVRLRFSYVRLWGATPADPWSATSTTGSLDEVRAYWLNAANNMSTIAGSRDLVHFVSGKSVQGGVAYVNVLCSQSFGFAASQVHGSFDPTKPSTMWDVMVFAHETGHMFGSLHTHCYSPPVDKCYAQESGCYDGPVVLSRGTVMSYCHLGGGIANIDLAFGNVVSARIATSVAGATCLASVGTAVCGNGTQDAGEQCDDGNAAPGDCCSPLCQREAAGSACTDDGDICTTDQCTVAGVCSHAPIPACGVTTSTSTSSTRTTTSTATSTTRAPRATTTSTSSTSSTTVPDADGDGVRDGADDCPATPLGDLVNARGCSVCPCTARADDSPWATHRAYMRCIRGEARARLDAGRLTATEARAIVRQHRQTTCGSRTLTRCCIYPATGPATCKLMSAARCEAADQLVGLTEDVGGGNCSPSPCGP